MISRIFQLVWNFTLGLADCIQFVRQINRLDIGVEKPGRTKKWLMWQCQHCPGIRKKFSGCFTKWLTFWTVWTWRFVCRCCNTMWTSQKMRKLKSLFLQENWRKRSSNNFCLLEIKLMHLKKNSCKEVCFW